MSGRGRALAMLIAALAAAALSAACGPVALIDLVEKLTKDDDPPAPTPDAAPTPTATTPTPTPDAAVDGCAAPSGACESARGCCEGACSEDHKCEACKDGGAVCNYFQGGGCCVGYACEPQGDNGNGTCLSCRRSGDPIPALASDPSKPLVRVCCSKQADESGTRCR